MTWPQGGGTHSRLVNLSNDGSSAGVVWQGLPPAFLGILPLVVPLALDAVSEASAHDRQTSSVVPVSRLQRRDQQGFEPLVARGVDLRVDGRP
jgi:hypothetical protein